MNRSMRVPPWARLVGLALLVVFVFLLVAPAGQAQDADTTGLKPGETVVYRQTIPVNIVFVGFDRDDIAVSDVRTTDTSTRENSGLGVAVTRAKAMNGTPPCCTSRRKVLPGTACCDCSRICASVLCATQRARVRSRSTPWSVVATSAARDAAIKPVARIAVATRTSIRLKPYAVPDRPVVTGSRSRYRRFRHHHWSCHRRRS